LLGRHIRSFVFIPSIVITHSFIRCTESLRLSSDNLLSVDLVTATGQFGAAGLTGLNLCNLLVAVIAAVAVLVIYHMIRRAV
jgi:hypothetical protein